MTLRYCLEKEDASDYVLCDAIGQPAADSPWRRECFRVVGDHERPLLLQSLWKPKEGFSRRFEIQLRASVEEQSVRERDTVTAGQPPLRGGEFFPGRPSLSHLSRGGGDRRGRSHRSGGDKGSAEAPTLICVLLRGPIMVPSNTARGGGGEGDVRSSRRSLPAAR